MANSMMLPDHVLSNYGFPVGEPHVEPAEYRVITMSVDGLRNIAAAGNVEALLASVIERINYDLQNMNTGVEICYKKHPYIESLNDVAQIKITKHASYSHSFDKPVEVLKEPPKKKQVAVDKNQPIRKVFLD